MTKVETLDKVSKRAGYGLFATAWAGQGFSSFPISLGGGLDAAAIAVNSPSYIHGHNLNMLNPFGGFNTYDAVIHYGANGTSDIAWHAVYHPYTFGQGFDVAMGEATLALLATAGVSKLASVVGRRFSRGFAKK